MTNGDRIMQMSNEEFIRFVVDDMCKFCIYNNDTKCMSKSCKEGIKAYLDMEVQ